MGPRVPVCPWCSVNASPRSSLNAAGSGPSFVSQARRAPAVPGASHVFSSGASAPPLAAWLTHVPPSRPLLEASSDCFPEYLALVLQNTHCLAVTCFILAFSPKNVSSSVRRGPKSSPCKGISQGQLRGGRQQGTSCLSGQIFDQWETGGVDKFPFSLRGLS